MPIITLFGGSGFIGRYAARKLAKRGWRVRVAVRRPNEAMFLRPYGDVGQVEPIQANIRDEDSTRRALEGSDAAINFVGILHAMGKQTFEAVQEEGAARIARIAKEQGATRMVQISAIGADAESEVPYARTKALAEQAVLSTLPSSTILRPSIVFGPEDQFFNRFAGMARMLPVLPLVGGDTKFQPVYVDDVAEAAVRALEDDAAAGQTFELGGPDVATMRELFELMLEVIQRKRPLLPVPDWAARLQGKVFQMSAAVGIPPVVTEDQVAMLGVDNVVADGAKTLADLGITPTAMEAVLPSYLYRFRAYGQYARMNPKSDQA